MEMDHGGSNGKHTMSHKMGYTHMTFFWGKNSEILFSGWPGTRGGHYALALIVSFVLAILVEWLSFSHLKGWFLRMVVYTIRVGLAYLVMLAIMSFNGGVFIVVVAGHAVGFLLFGRPWKEEEPDRKAPVGNCC